MLIDQLTEIMKAINAIYAADKEVKGRIKTGIWEFVQQVCGECLSS